MAAAAGREPAHAALAEAAAPAAAAAAAAVASAWLVLWGLARSFGQGSSTRRRRQNQAWTWPVAVHVAPCYMSWRTTALNGWLYAFGSRHKRLLRAWYNAGSAAGVLAMFGITLVRLCSELLVSTEISCQLMSSHFVTCQMTIKYRQRTMCVCVRRAWASFPNEMTRAPAQPTEESVLHPGPALGNSLELASYTCVSIKGKPNPASSHFHTRGTSHLYRYIAVIPGVTLPWGEMGYLWWAMASSMAVHEVGHGLAAASEGVRMQHFAVFVALVFPGALVALSADQLELLPPTKALRIYCAGVWHNLVKHAPGTWLIKQEASFLLRLPVTEIAWVQVVLVPRSSPMAGHLESGDLVTAVDGTAITTGEAWLRSLTAHQEQQHVVGVRTPANESSALGYCVPASLLSSFPAATFTDLQAVADRSTSKMEKLHPAVEPCGPLELAFRQVDHSVGLDSSSLMLMSPQDLAMKQTSRALQGACLRPRDVAAFASCRSRGRDAEHGPTCLEGSTCMQPILANGRRLWKITLTRTACWPSVGNRSTIDSSRRGSLRWPRLASPSTFASTSSCEDWLVFVGTASALAHSVQLSGFEPRRRLPLLARSRLLPLPGAVEKLLLYTFNVSAALALLNIAPVYFLDGEAVLGTILQLLAPQLSQGSWRRAMHVTLGLGSLLLVAALVQSFAATIIG
eukprot:SM000024S07744  [mRNA]  locus=s24:118285:122687:- [translate_table: standard]